MRRGASVAARYLSRGIRQREAAAAQSCATAARALSSSPAALLQLGASDSRLAASTATPSASSSPWPSASAAAQPPLVPFAAAAALAQQQSRSATTNTGGAQEQVMREAAKRASFAGRAPAVAPTMLPGIVHIQSSRNNTILTLTDEAGNTKAWASAGAMGFKNARKCTSYAAEAAAEKLAGDARKLGIGQVQLRVRGLGQGKQSSIKTLHANGLVITSIQECTPLPHNGCRAPKKRRI